MYITSWGTSKMNGFSSRSLHFNLTFQPYSACQGVKVWRLKCGQSVDSLAGLARPRSGSPGSAGCPAAWPAWWIVVAAKRCPTCLWLLCSLPLTFPRRPRSSQFFGRKGAVHPVGGQNLEKRTERKCWEICAMSSGEVGVGR